MEAEWIWGRANSITSFGSLHVPPFQDRRFHNLYALFRKACHVPANLTRILAQVSGDSRYKLSVNGQYVGRRPARCDPAWQYYDEYDLKSFLRPRGKVIAPLVHYYEEKIGWYLSGGQRFLFECALEHLGRSRVVKTEARWKFLEAPMWAQDAPRINGSLSFVEVDDARQNVKGWNLTESAGIWRFPMAGRDDQ